MTQFILDCFPDTISQHGLLGCAISVAAPLYLVAACVWLRSRNRSYIATMRTRIATM